MAITRFRPEIWSAQLLVALRKALVYAAPGVVNRDYEGEIREAGDTVRITSISDPTIGTYAANTTVITPEELNDAQRTLVVDQAKYFAFYVDDVDARQAKGNVIPEAMSRAAYKIADQVDQYVAAFYTGVNAANALGTIPVAAATPTAFYDNVLVPLSVKLDEANVPTEGRYCIIPPWLHGRALRDDRFVRADASGTTEALRNGVIGTAAGFSIRKSNNVPLVTGDDYAVMAGVDMAISFAEQINKTEAYRPEAKFADAVKGLALYGAKLVRPEAIATAIVSQT
ncbi:P22 coat protein - protein 5 domain protein [Amycolatopsis sp. WAC 04182]|uniref:phage major capsid protein n=1 Tax=Amycolatopsis sp. WAC 04182 TaxID=2203198 RepID=UPI000F774A12|nr:P22 phage major capsid protein family protein [Amycolatopsis sp. WAC 04182]RSN65425.1 P22 coat protein - protein 5 domain protein [Amycolatopsis sp. WAC 04182]